MISQVVSDLDFEVSLFQNGYYRSFRLYQDPAIQLLYDKKANQLVNHKFNLTFISDTTAKIQSDKIGANLYCYKTASLVKSLPQFYLDTIVSVNKPIQTQYCSFLLLCDTSKLNVTNDYYFQFHTIRELVNEFKISNQLRVVKDD